MSTIVRPENITFRPQAGTCPPQLCPKALFPSAEASSLLQPRFRRRSAEDPSGKPGEGAGSFPATIRNRYVQTALPIAHTSPGQTGRRRNSMLHGIRHGPPGKAGKHACFTTLPAKAASVKTVLFLQYRHSPEPGQTSGELRHRAAERQSFPHGTRPFRRCRAPSPSSGALKESLIPGRSRRFQENRARMPEYCIYGPQRGRAIRKA